MNHPDEAAEAFRRATVAAQQPTEQRSAQEIEDLAAARREATQLLGRLGQ